MVVKRKFCITAKVEVESIEIEDDFGLNAEDEASVRRLFDQLDKEKLEERFKENIKFGKIEITKIKDITEDPMEESYNLFDWKDFKWSFAKDKEKSFFEDISG